MAASTWKNRDTVTARIEPGPYAAESKRLWISEAKNFGFKLTGQDRHTYFGTLTLTFERTK